MSFQPKFHLLADFFAIVSGATALAAWQEQLDWTLRILASLVAIIAGGIAIYRYFKKPAKTTATQPAVPGTET
jgi:peptidoglycan/LPS O-acetylase OafA/YrhL